jgi:membrane protein YqaA with SNARE-associated domain
MSLDRLANWLAALGPLGLFLAAALDAFVPLAQVVEPTLIVLAYRSQNPLPWVALAVAGSVLGTSLLFLLVRKGGEALAGRRLSGERRAQVEGLVARWGVLAVAVGGILPPPFPFKGVILVAGLGRMRLAGFVAAVALARTVRYGLEAVLAVRYGDQVLRFMARHYPLVAVGLAVLLVVAVVVVRHYRLRHAPLAAPAE